MMNRCPSYGTLLAASSTFCDERPLGRPLVPPNLSPLPRFLWRCNPRNRLPSLSRLLRGHLALPHGLLPVCQDPLRPATPRLHPSSLMPRLLPLLRLLPRLLPLSRRPPHPHPRLPPCASHASDKVRRPQRSSSAFPLPRLNRALTNSGERLPLSSRLISPAPSAAILS